MYNDVAIESHTFEMSKGGVLLHARNSEPMGFDCLTFLKLQNASSIRFRQ
jgi:hypothetical protein